MLPFSPLFSLNILDASSRLAQQRTVERIRNPLIHLERPALSEATVSLLAIQLRYDSPISAEIHNTFGGEHQIRASTTPFKLEDADTVTFQTECTLPLLTGTARQTWESGKSILQLLSILLFKGQLNILSYHSMPAQQKCWICVAPSAPISLSSALGIFRMSSWN